MNAQKGNEEIELSDDDEAALHAAWGDDVSTELSDDVEDLIATVEARINRELTDDERDAFADEYLKQLDDDESEIIENWCNQYGGDTCKGEGAGKTGNWKKVKTTKEKKEKVKKEVKEKAKTKREKAGRTSAPKRDKHIEKLKGAFGDKGDTKKDDFGAALEKAMSELKSEKVEGKAKDAEEKGKRGVFRKAWDFLVGNAEGDELEQMLIAAIDAVEEELGRDLTDEEIDHLTDELVETTDNAFCPTGAGGGIDNSCGKDLKELQKHVGPNATDADPKRTKSFDLEPHKEVVSDILKSVEDHAATKSFKSLTITDFVNKFPKLDLKTIHGILGKMHHEGLIRLGPFTQALATHDKPEHILPLERDAKYFVRKK